MQTVIPRAEGSRDLKGGGVRMIAKLRQFFLLGVVTLMMVFVMGCQLFGPDEDGRTLSDELFGSELDAEDVLGYDPDDPYDEPGDSGGTTVKDSSGETACNITIEKQIDELWEAHAAATDDAEVRELERKAFGLMLDLQMNESY